MKMNNRMRLILVIFVVFMLFLSVSGLLAQKVHGQENATNQPLVQVDGNVIDS